MVGEMNPSFSFRLQQAIWPRNYRWAGRGGSEDSIGQEGPDVFFDQRCIDAWKKKKISLSFVVVGVLVLIVMGCFVGLFVVLCARLTVFLLPSYTVLVHCRANLIALVCGHKVGEVGLFCLAMNSV